MIKENNINISEDKFKKISNFVNTLLEMDYLKNNSEGIEQQIQEIFNFIKIINNFTKNKEKFLLTFPKEFKNKMKFIKNLNLINNCEIVINNNNKITNSKFNNFNNFIILDFIEKPEDRDNLEDPADTLGSLYDIIKPIYKSNFPNKPIREMSHGYLTNDLFYLEPEDFKYEEIIYESKEYYIVNLLSYFYKNINIKYKSDNNNFYFCSMDLDLDINNYKKFQYDLFTYFIILCYHHNDLYKKYFE